MPMGKRTTSNGYITFIEPERDRVIRCNKCGRVRTILRGRIAPTCPTCEKIERKEKQRLFERQFITTAKRREPNGNR